MQKAIKKQGGKQIKAVNSRTTAIYRFIGRDIYIKSNDPTYSSNLIAQVESKGGKVVAAGDWWKCDIFGDNVDIKLGRHHLNLKEDSDDEVQEALVDLFSDTLKKSGFMVEVTDL